jgi:lipoprotein-anchoring transpeptidase ErfK/SrfK
MMQSCRYVFSVVLISWGSFAFAGFKHVAFTPPVQMPTQSIYVDLSERALYLYLGEEQALRYPVAVGKAGKSWAGYTYIESKHIRPDWEPPAEVRADVPHLRNVPYIPGGDPSNPMGAAALKLSHGDYAIHGTTAKMRSSIGSAASYGCIRMYNEDIMDLFQRVDIGALVVVGY